LGFISLKPKKKPSQTEKTEPNRFEPVFVLKTEPKPVGLNWFWFDFYFLKKKIGLITFFYKNQTESKMITLATTFRIRS
jgi:hypothetical protein